MCSQSFNCGKVKLFKKNILLFLFSLLLLDCTKNKNEPEILNAVYQQKTQDAAAVVQEKNSREDLKKIAEIVRFLASLEKESLKVINSSIQYTQLELISFALDKHTGFKRANVGFFCHQFEINTVSPNEFAIVAVCEKPVKILAHIKVGDSQGDITFSTRNWAPIVGELTSLTADDRNCYYQLKNKVVSLFNCKKTVYGVAPDFIEELRLEKFEYNKENSEMLSIEGGAFRDLVKRREIKMQVPMTGAIEIMERELKVRDDFEHLLKKRGR